MKLLTNLVFAVTVTAVMLVAASAFFAATIGTDAHLLGALASGISAGSGGAYVGTIARRRARGGRRRPSR